MTSFMNNPLPVWHLQERQPKEICLQANRLKMSVRISARQMLRKEIRHQDLKDIPEAKSVFFLKIMAL